MPLMNPLVAATLRRHWPVLGAVSVLIVFFAVDQLWFQPAARRYGRALKQADELGMALTPESTPAFLPPRLFALFTDNTMSSQEAVNLGNSGTLTAQLLEDITNLTVARGLQVLVTEPGAVSQQPQSAQVRAHVKLRCRYDQFVLVLEDMTRSGKLFAVDRFSISPDASGSEILDLWVSRMILKQDKTAK